MNRRIPRTAAWQSFRTYLACTLFVAVFALVYNHFGHGVRSWYMDLAWIWPAAGLLISAIEALRRKDIAAPTRVFLSCGLATLTCGFLMQGIFEIAGTNSAWMPVYYIAGVCLLAAAFLFRILARGDVNTHENH